METGYIICPCCGQLLAVSYGNPLGMTARIPISNLNQNLFSNVKNSIRDMMIDPGIINGIKENKDND